MQAKQRPVSRKGRSAALYGFAVILGVCLAVSGFLVSSYTYLVIPVIAYATAVGCNFLTQYSICNSVNVSQTLTLASFALLGSFVTLGLTDTVKFLSSPIRSLMPTMSDETVAQVSKAFYLFWAGVYAQIAAGGFLQTCPST